MLTRPLRTLLLSVGLVVLLVAGYVELYRSRLTLTVPTAAQATAEQPQGILLDGLLARDAIPPLDSPQYVAASAAPWLEDDDLVLGVALNGEVRAYPIKLMNWHEIVNETLGGVEVVITYCPLCHSGVVFERRLGDRTLSFGNTGGLYESNLLMYDRETGSYWYQLLGQAIRGPLSGKRLTQRPATMSPWSDWRALHPQTLVLSRNTGYDRPYDRAFSEGGRHPPVSTQDDRLDDSVLVLGVEVQGRAKAYPLKRLGPSAFSDELAGRALVVFAGKDQGAVFSPYVSRWWGLSRTQLDFVFEQGQFVDRNTQSVWTTEGRAVSGPLRGQQLKALPSTTSYWFAWVTGHPHTEVYQGKLGM